MLLTHIWVERSAFLVDVETDVINDAVKEMAKNVAMQAAALKPLYTNRNEVSQEYIDHEKEILTVAAKNEKPDANEKIINGMVMGRINKELKEICLLDQVYVKAEDGKQSVAKYVEEVAKANGAKIAIKSFVRFETGEGIERKKRTSLRKLQNRWECNFLREKVLEALGNPVKRAFSRAFLRSEAKSVKYHKLSYFTGEFEKFMWEKLRESYPPNLNMN